MVEDVTEKLSQWAAGARWGALTAADRDRVVDTLVDTVGVALAGSRAPEFEPVVAAAEQLGWLAPGGAEWWGDPRPLHAGAAALLNATAGHLLDFDDVHYLLHGHPSTVLWPALIAIGQEEGLVGERLLDGYVAGVGVMAAVSRMFGPRHYSVGWHSTSTIGAIGAAAGAAVALAEDADGVRAAMGAAVSMASGVRANFGTVLKPFHAGLAARSAIEAVRLVRAGVTPSPDALTGALGAVAVFGDGSWPSADGLSRLAAAVVEAAEHGLVELGIKPYPACRGSHYGIDAALTVHEELAGAEVERLVVEVPLGAKTALLYDDPTDGLQARFSLPYTVATTVAHGRPTLAHFADDAVHDPQTRALMARMTVIEDDSAGDLSASMEGRYAVVAAHTVDGRVVRCRVDDARGSWSRPLPSEEVDEKFLGTAGEALDPAAARRLLTLLRDGWSGRQVRGILASQGG